MNSSSSGPPSDPATTSAHVPMIVASPAMAAVLHQITRAAAVDARVLVTGESGVGKDLVAREIHLRSARAGRPFVALNCAGVTDTLLESEFFGHVRGSFTDAHRDRPGRLRQAHRGTLFLDEVGEMSRRMQAMLLRFLDDGLVQATGSDEPQAPVDVRIITATHRNLADMVATGDFRDDLLYRLRVLHIAVPPLRDRRQDVRALIAHFAAAANRPIALSESALRLLEGYDWPGNVRELRNILDQMLWLLPGTSVTDADLPDPIRAAVATLGRERRHQVADDLYEGLTSGACTFWEHVHARFRSRNLTRHDVRALVARGLQAANGNYRDVVRLFRIPDTDYARFMSFLAVFDCTVDFRTYRGGTAPAPTRHALPRAVVPAGRR